MFRFDCAVLSGTHVLVGARWKEGLSQRFRVEVFVAVAAGYLVSNLALYVACLVFRSHVRDLYGEAVASRAVVFLLINPVTVFYSTIYSESLFLLCIVAACHAAHRNRWPLAGLCGAGAALTYASSAGRVSTIVTARARLGPSLR